MFININNFRYENKWTACRNPEILSIQYKHNLKGPKKEIILYFISATRNVHILNPLFCTSTVRNCLNEMMEKAF